MRAPFYLQMIKWLNERLERLRKGLLERGYACDVCKREIFDYPTHRLCESCERKLPKVTKPCPNCGRERRAEGLCLDCKVLPPTFTRGISPFIYKDEGGVIVNRLKNGQPELSAYLGERMAETFLEKCGGEIADRSLLIVAVPMSKEKVRERGYNQAERLAEQVEKQLKRLGVLAEIDFSVMEKSRETVAQKKMTRRERAENVQGAFGVKDRSRCKGQTVILVDDIMTTGATGNECARKLFSAGAERVYFLTATSLMEPK